MTPTKGLAVIDVRVRGTELPPTLEAAHAQLRDLARALASIDYAGVWITRDEANTLGGAIHIGMIQDIYFRDDRPKIAHACMALGQ